MQFSRMPAPRVFLDDVEFRTGDLILFKAYNNFNSLVLCNYFGHCGVVHVVDGRPMIFEANGIENMPLRAHHPKTGIFYTDLASRIKKYKGRVYLKRLTRVVSPEIEAGLAEFIKYARKCFHYDTAVFPNALRKLMGEGCGGNTNCGQIAFLALIKCGVIPLAEYDRPRLHHLKYICSEYRFETGHTYEPIVEIVDQPFDR